MVCSKRRTGEGTPPGCLDSVGGGFIGRQDASAGSELADPYFQQQSQSVSSYLNPTPKTDIGFRYFSSKARPVTGDGPEMSFRTAVRRRAEQNIFLKDLATISYPKLPPALHDTASWQVWLREMWDDKWRGLFTLERIMKSNDIVSRYFEVFTAHVPHDLLEGCKEQNYLTRSFPRTVTGALIHDCAVYAVRWIHILGRLLNPRTSPAGINRPRIFLVEMPAHVGVMVR
jgi:hypothetical protein